MFLRLYVVIAQILKCSRSIYATSDKASKLMLAEYHQSHLCSATFRELKSRTLQIFSSNVPMTIGVTRYFFRATTL